MIWLIPAIYLIEWSIFIFFTNTWDILLGTKYLMVSVIAWVLVSYSCNDNLFKKSIINLFAIDSSIDLIKYILWQLLEKNIDLSIPEIFIFLSWFIFIIKRNYKYISDPINEDNINILFSRPNSRIEIIKSLFGYPVCSICIISNGYLWSFRKCSGMFEKSKYNKNWINNHISIDTGIKCNDAILYELENILGEDRKPYIKCVWSIRCVLNLLGGKYKIKSCFDYIPGIYFMRILKE